MHRPCTRSQYLSTGGSAHPFISELQDAIFCFFVSSPFGKHIRVGRSEQRKQVALLTDDFVHRNCLTLSATQNKLD